MDKWRLYFDRSPDQDLWTICERALAIAYLDRPEDFPSHRDRFAQKLYAPEKLCLAMDDGSSHKRAADGGERGRRAVREGEKGKKMAAEGGKEREKASVDGEKGKKKALVEGEKSKKKAMYEEKEDRRIGLSNKIPRSSDVDDCMGDDDDDVDDDVGVGDGHDGNEDSNDVIDDVEDDGNDDEDGDDRLRKCKYDEAEALTDEMEEEILLKRDMLKIKESLLDSYKPEAEVFDTLQRLELMQLSFDVLKETEIGKTVNTLRKHSSGRIRALAKKLVNEWKDTAEHWYKSAQDVTAAAKSGRPLAIESPLDDDEDGLPSPPMDEGALLTGQTASLEMYQLFDFMDDETAAGSGNPASTHLQSLKNNGHIPGIHDGRRESLGNGISKREKNEKMANGSLDVRRQSRERQEKQAAPSDKQVATEISPAKVPRANLNPSDLDERLIAAKKKLQENYQQAENAKRQRTIQVMGLEELPMGGPKRAKAGQFIRGKPSSHHRPHLQGRR